MTIRVHKSRVSVSEQKIKSFQFLSDDVMGDEDEEEESDAIVAQVLDELGLQLNDKLGDVPVASGITKFFFFIKLKKKFVYFFREITIFSYFFQGSLAPAAANKNKPQAVAAGGATDDDDADLQARLDDLRRD